MSVVVDGAYANTDVFARDEDETEEQEENSEEQVVEENEELVVEENSFKEELERMRRHLQILKLKI